jgi:hypothetical protein
MPYYIDDKKTTLQDLQKRLQSSDLVPSRAPLLDNVEEKLTALGKSGISSLADLRAELKTEKLMRDLAARTGLEVDYLILLRREVESYFPKSFPLTDFNWLPSDVPSILQSKGIKNAASFFEKVSIPETKTELIEAGIDPVVLDELLQYTDLTRVQWISPITARILVLAGYGSAVELAAANPDELCERFARVNNEHQYFQGKVGLRDMKRLVYAASFVP